MARRKLRLAPTLRRGDCSNSRPVSAEIPAFEPPGIYRAGDKVIPSLHRSSYSIRGPETAPREHTTRPSSTQRQERGRNDKHPRTRGGDTSPLSLSFLYARGLCG